MVFPVNHFNTVSELTTSIKNLLSENLSDVALEGEISNFKPATSGHWYFNIKDAHSMISGVMFRGKNSRVTFLPQDGMQVRIIGNVTVYEQRGQYQIVCEAMIQAGLGKILAELENRKKRLAEEGLFHSEHKKPIPLFPKKIVIITSPTGAAIRDILNVLDRRAHASSVLILPAAVQGVDAPAEICRQLIIANTFTMGDVIILARGGGSIEDLLAFSDEQVVREVFKSNIPVVTGIGHETDTSIVDFASDYRAPTPSAAAELVAGHQGELLDRVFNAGRGIVSGLSGLIERMNLALIPFRPQRLEDTFRAYLQPYLQRIDDATDDLGYGLKTITHQKRLTLSRLKTSLEASSPFEVLERGYAMIENQENGQLITRGNKITKKMNILIRFSDTTKCATVFPENKED